METVSMEQAKAQVLAEEERERQQAVRARAQRIVADANREKVRAEQAARYEARRRAISALVEAEAPRITLEYQGVKMTFRLRGALDPALWLTIESDLATAVQGLRGHLSQRLGVAQERGTAPALSHVERDFLVRWLQDQCRRSIRLGAVEIETGARK